MMKTPIAILSFLLLSLGVSAFAQTPKGIDGFLDMLWGTPTQDAKQKMLERPGVTFKRNVPGGIIFSGGVFAGRPANTFALLFSGGRLYRGDVSLNPAGNRHEVYESIKKELITKYGPPAKSGKDGFTRWTFHSTTFHSDDEALELSVGQKFNEVNLSYINESMAKASNGGKGEL